MVKIDIDNRLINIQRSLNYYNIYQIYDNIQMSNGHFTFWENKYLFCLTAYYTLTAYQCVIYIYLLYICIFNIYLISYAL